MKVKKSYRVEEAVIDHIERYAAANNLSNTDALEALLLKGINAESAPAPADVPPLYEALDGETDGVSEAVEAWRVIPMLKEQVADLRADKEQLRNDLEAANRRADKLGEQLTQAQQIAINAQALQHENRRVGLLEAIKQRLLLKAPKPAETPVEPIVEE